MDVNTSMAELGTTGEWYNLTLVNTTFPAVDTTGSAAAAAAAEAEAEAGKPQWRRILDIIQIIVLSWGVVTNGVTAVCFRKQSAGFSRQIQLLFEHQSWADFLSCLVGFLTVVLPTYWSLGQYHLDYVLCYLWHAQVLYWVLAANSYYGLVIIAFDRYMSVCRPMTYKALTVRRLLAILGVSYALNVLFVSPLALYVKMDGETCVPGNTIKGERGVHFVKAHAVIMTLYEYVGPCVYFFVFYGQVIWTLKRKKETSAVEGSATVEKASAQIMKAAFAVTGLFMFTIGWAYGYYVFGVLEIWWTFEFNSPWQQIDVLMSSINSSANPLLYYVLMPRFRRALRRLLPRRCGGRAGRVAPGSDATTSQSAKTQTSIGD